MKKFQIDEDFFRHDDIIPLKKQVYDLNQQLNAQSVEISLLRQQNKILTNFETIFSKLKDFDEKLTSISNLQEENKRELEKLKTLLNQEKPPVSNPEELHNLQLFYDQKRLREKIDRIESDSKKIGLFQRRK